MSVSKRPCRRTDASVRPGVALLLAVVASVGCVTAKAAQRALLVIPDAPAASSAEPTKVSPYALALRRQHRAAEASGVDAHALPPSMRQGQQGYGRGNEQAVTTPRP